MVVPDAYRAQLYFRRLRLGMQDVATTLTELGLGPQEVDTSIEGLERTLAAELDSIILPTVAFELAIARQLVLLRGKTPGQRYESFFVSDRGWQPWVRSILLRYRFLDEAIGSYVTTTVAAVQEALERLRRDLGGIRRTLLKSNEHRLIGVGVAEGADRHRDGRRVLWFRFNRGTTVVYKPIDLGTYLLFDRFVRWLDLDAEHACYLPRVLPRDGYGWMEFVPHVGCRSNADIKAFFLRAGILLAAAESLNLADAHAGNLVARGPFPVIVDQEALLHNHSLASAQDQPDIFTTLIVQHLPPEGSPFGVAAGLMCPPVPQLNRFAAVADDERTDTLSVRFGRPSQRGPVHLPRLGNEHVTVHDYVDDVVAGYRTGYEIISDGLRTEQGPAGWPRAAAQVRPRIIVRSTMYYAHLMCLLEQPEILTSRQNAEATLRTQLSQTGKYWEWEIPALLHHDIPYFFHAPGERHLYGSASEREENLFPVSAIEYLKSRWRRRSRTRRDDNCDLLRELLPLSPRP
jgi:lantibiotic modifying enzyme